MREEDDETFLTRRSLLHEHWWIVVYSEIVLQAVEDINWRSFETFLTSSLLSDLFSLFSHDFVLVVLSETFHFT